MVLVQRGLPLPVGASAVLARVVLRTSGRARWRGVEKLPLGRAVYVANHVSWLDPVALMDLLLAERPVPAVLAKAALFRVPLVGGLLRAMDAVPVVRQGSRAVAALHSAEDALRRGRQVVIYPEGTLTKDPQGWPMVARTGAARLALRTGAPVVPIAQWGSQRLVPRTGLPRPWPRPHLDVLVGDPVDLSAFTGRALTAEVLREATEAITDAVVALLEEVRGASAPPRWDPRTGARRAA